MLPYLKKYCITMVKLLCGVSNLACDILGDINPYQRRCTQCEEGVEETVYHFIMSCPLNTVKRSILFRDICSALSDQNVRVFNDFSDTIKFYIVMGLDFPFSHEELLEIRKISCINVNKMYSKREKLLYN